jgi:hypothetical protein
MSRDTTRTGAWRLYPQVLGSTGPRGEMTLAAHYRVTAHGEAVFVVDGIEAFHIEPGTEAKVVIAARRTKVRLPGTLGMAGAVCIAAPAGGLLVALKHPRNVPGLEHDVPPKDWKGVRIEGSGEHLAPTAIDDPWPHHRGRRRYVPLTAGRWPEREALQQLRVGAAEGVWLVDRGATGPRALGFGWHSTALKLDPVPESLNHACTRLSQQFEPWRISHSVNVFRDVFARADDWVWRPLEWFRGRFAALVAQAECA